MDELIDKILAGIVTYNPEISRLKENLVALLSQVNHIYIIDNGSTNLSEIYSLIEFLKTDKVKIESYGINKGIAKALKDIMIYSYKNRYEWVLSLDQDSVIEPELINEYIKAAYDANNKNVGIFTCLIKDRNFYDSQYEKQNEVYLDVPYCITSASFTNVEKYMKTDGYDETFFIDAVDFDICYSMREAGYFIRRINYIGLYHEVGHGVNRWFLWKKIVVYHQKPFRIYYYARNLKIMHKKHKKMYPYWKFFKTELALFMRIFLYENSKWKKIVAFKRGISGKPYKV